MSSAVEVRRPVKVWAMKSGGRTILATWTTQGDYELTLAADLSQSHYGKLNLTNKIVPIKPIFVIRGHASVILIAVDILEQLRRLSDTRYGAMDASELWLTMMWCYMDAMDRKEAWHAYHKNDGNWQPNFLEVTSEGFEGRKRYSKLVDWEAVKKDTLAELRERKRGWEK